MRKTSILLILLAAALLITSCQGISPATRKILTYSDLMTGFEAEDILDEDALRMPDEALTPSHRFEGRLELMGELNHGDAEILRVLCPMSINICLNLTFPLSRWMTI